MTPPRLPSAPPLTSANAHSPTLDSLGNLTQITINVSTGALSAAAANTQLIASAGTQPPPPPKLPKRKGPSPIATAVLIAGGFACALSLARWYCVFLRWRHARQSMSGAAGHAATRISNGPSQVAPALPPPTVRCSLVSRSIPPLAKGEQLADENNGAVECAICLAPLAPGDEALGLPCGHEYHESCITQWLAAKPMPQCPLCKAYVLVAPPQPIGKPCAASPSRGQVPAVPTAPAAASVDAPVEVRGVIGAAVSEPEELRASDLRDLLRRSCSSPSTPRSRPFCRMSCAFASFPCAASKRDHSS